MFEIKDWEVALFATFAGIGFISAIYFIVKFILWVIHHVRVV